MAPNQEYYINPLRRRTRLIVGGIGLVFSVGVAISMLNDEFAKPFSPIASFFHGISEKLAEYNERYFAGHNGPLARTRTPVQKKEKIKDDRFFGAPFAEAKASRKNRAGSDYRDLNALPTRPPAPSRPYVEPNVEEGTQYYLTQ